MRLKTTASAPGSAAARRPSRPTLASQVSSGEMPPATPTLLGATIPVRSYAFIAEKDWYGSVVRWLVQILCGSSLITVLEPVFRFIIRYNFTRADLAADDFNRRVGNRTIPLVLDWAIRNEPCLHQRQQHLRRRISVQLLQWIPRKSLRQRRMHWWALVKYFWHLPSSFLLLISIISVCFMFRFLNFFTFHLTNNLFIQILMSARFENKILMSMKKIYHCGSVETRQVVMSVHAKLATCIMTQQNRCFGTPIFPSQGAPAPCTERLLRQKRRRDNEAHEH
jgi:hypothetical protein